MCYLSAAADTERSGLSADFHWRCWGLSCSGLTVRPRWNISSAALLFCILYLFFVFLLTSPMLKSTAGWQKVMQFSGHARFACTFPNLATHLPKSWRSVRSGCLINSLFFGFQLKCPQWVSATGAGHGNSHWICQCNKGEFKVNVSLLAERRITLKYSSLCRWTCVHLTLVNAVGTSTSISCSVKYVFILQVCHDFI